MTGVLFNAVVIEVKDSVSFNKIRIFLQKKKIIECQTN